jgi:hypothetical protein
MQQVIEQLNNIVTAYPAKFLNLPEEELSFKPAAGKWSKKEIIGHLIDSAQNNIRRFITAQYQTNPHIVYNQNEWVAVQNYQQYDSTALITLWQLLNKHIIIILQNMPAEKYQQQCNTGKDKEELHTVEFLATDYIAHHLHHLKQIV